MSRLPGWMKMREDPSSIGWQFINAAYGQQAQLINEFIVESLDNQFVGTANPNEPCYVYTTRHDISQRKLTSNLSISAYGMNYLGASGTIPLTETFTIEDFFNKIATRITYHNETINLPGSEADLIGVVYCTDYAPSGIIDAQEVFIVNEDVLASASGYPTKVYDANTHELIHQYNYGRMTQSHANTGFDEVIEFASGVATTNHVPLPESFCLYDYQNLDPSGNPGLVPTGYYILDDRTITDASGLYSNYIAEYDYIAFDKATYITTPDNFWDMNRWRGSRPLFSIVPASGEYQGTEMPFQIARSPVSHGIALSLHPLDVRPGTEVDVTYKYVTFASGLWTDTSSSYNLQVTDSHIDGNLSDIYGLRLFQGAADITYDASPTVSIDNSTNTMTVSPLANYSTYSNLDVFLFYRASRTGSFLAQSSYSQYKNEEPPYPYDYIIEKKFNEDTGRHQDHILPASIVHVSVSGLLDTGESLPEAVYASMGYMPVLDLSNATQEQFTVIQDLQFGGLSFDKDRRSVWAIETTNQRLYQYNVDNGALISRQNILKPNRIYDDDIASFIIPSGIEGETLDPYPYIPQDMDLLNTPRGIAYLEGYLWLLNYPYSPDTVYYVDPSGGNDSNPGTSRALAFRTLYKAASEVEAGDWVIAMPGIHETAYYDVTYHSTDFTANGTAQHPVIITFEDGATVRNSHGLPTFGLDFYGDYYIIRNLVSSTISGRQLVIRVIGNNCKLYDCKISDLSHIDQITLEGNNNEVSFLRVANNLQDMGQDAYAALVAEGNDNYIHHCLVVSYFYGGSSAINVDGDRNIVDHCTVATRKTYNHNNSYTYWFYQGRDCYQPEPGTRIGISVNGNYNIITNNLMENMMRGISIHPLSQGNQVNHNVGHCCFKYLVSGLGEIIFESSTIDYKGTTGISVLQLDLEGWHNNFSDAGGKDFGLFHPHEGWLNWTCVYDPGWIIREDPYVGLLAYQPSHSFILTADNRGNQVGYSYPGRDIDIGFFRIDTYDENRLDIEWNGENSTNPPYIYLPINIATSVIVTDMTVGPNKEFYLCGSNNLYRIYPMYDYYTVDHNNGIVYYREKYHYVDVDMANRPQGEPDRIGGS